MQIVSEQQMAFMVKSDLLNSFHYNRGFIDGRYLR